MQLFDALELKDGEMVCFAGAGGKTGLMLRLASECASRDRKVLVTTSTRMYIRQLQNCGQLVMEQDEGKLLGRLDDARRRAPACGPAGGWLAAAGRRVDGGGQGCGSG